MILGHLDIWYGKKHYHPKKFLWIWTRCPDGTHELYVRIFKLRIWWTENACRF